MIGIKKKISPYLIILLFIVIGYWQVSFFFYSLKWDLIDVVLPFRYYFSDCIQSGHFPFWNPFQQTGTPFYADLQAPTYYPELLITSLFGRYGVYTMHVLFIFYLFIASIGMYKLSFHFNKSRNASLIAGLSYAFSGYIVGHGQHFFLLVGAAWIPFVILSYIRLNQNRKIIDVFKSGIFAFLMITGAYQAQSIVMLYLMLLIFLYFLMQAIAEKSKKKIFQIIKLNFFFSLIIILFSLPLIASTLEIINFVERFEQGVGFFKTMEYSQPYTTLLSIILPFSTIKYSEFFGGIDASLINHYFGLIPLIFFIVSLFRKHSILEYLILGFGLLIFSLSFNFLPFWKIAYEHFPLMDLFLNPAYVSIFGILSILLISASYIAFFEKNIATEKNKIIVAGIVLLLVLLSLISISIYKLSLNDIKKLFSSNGVEEFMRNMSFYQNVFVQAFFHLVIVLGFIATILYHKKLKHAVVLIIVLLLTEIIFATQLNMNVTVVDMQSKPVNMQKAISLCPKEFTIPVNDKIIYNDNRNAFFSPFWRNTHIFTKQISFNAFSSFELKTFSKIDDDYTNLKNAVLNNHLFYFSDTIIPLKEFSDSTVDVPSSSKYLYLSDKDFGTLSDKIVKTDSSDIIEILEFSPNKVIVKTRTKNDQFFTMLQTNYKGWNAFVDNKPSPVYTSNFNYRTVFLPKGEHVIKYEYKNKKVLILYIISNILFTICILSLLGYWLFRRNNKVKTYIFIPSSILLLMIILLLRVVFKNDNPVTTNQYYNTRWANANASISIKQDFEDKKNNFDTLNVYSGKKSFIVKPDAEYTVIAEIKQKDKKIKKGTLAFTAQIHPNNYCKVLIVSEIKGEWHAFRTEKQIEAPNQWNEIRYYRNIPKLKDGEVVKIYLWNPNKEQFVIDDVTLNLFD